MFLTRTKAAFLLSAETLFREHPHIYMWTVTFAQVQSDWEGSKRFTEFLNHLREVVGRTGWGGLRVCELHKEHGIHFHLLVTERLAVDLVRRVGQCHGIGRIHVCRAQTNAGSYLGKYLAKQRSGPVTKTGRSLRRWAKFGDVNYTPVKNIVVDSEYTQYRRKENLPWLGWRQEVILRRCWLHGPKALKSAWFALKQGSALQDAFRLAIDTAEAQGQGIIIIKQQQKGPF